MLAEEKNRLSETPMLYSCGLCGKGYRSDKAHAQHLKSRSHILRASQVSSHQDEGNPIVKPLLRHPLPKLTPQTEAGTDESEDSGEWEEVDPDDELISEAMKNLTDLRVNESNFDSDMDGKEDDHDEGYALWLDPSCCFMCDLEHGSIESCIVHLHKQHGLFIPDIVYLKDPKGFLTYLGLKVPTFLPFLQV